MDMDAATCPPDPPTAGEMSAAASQLAFGQPIVQNNLRALVVEVMVDLALKPD